MLQDKINEEMLDVIRKTSELDNSVKDDLSYYQKIIYNGEHILLYELNAAKDVLKVLQEGENG